MRFSSLSLSIAILLSAVGCSRSVETGVSVDSTFKPFVSPAAVALVQIDVEALKKTPFYARHQAAIEAEGLNGMAERVGIDPRRDVHKLLVVWDGKAPVALAKGDFPAQTIDAKLMSLGAERSSYKNYTLFGDPNSAGRDSVTFVGGNLAVAGPTAAVHEALDRHAEGSAAIPEALRDQFSKIPRGVQVWEVSTGPLLENIPLRSDVESLLSNISNYITGTRAGFAVESGVRLDAQIACVSKDGAQRVRDALRGGIGLARLATNNNNLDMLRLWDSFKISQDDQVVNIVADLSPDLTDKLVANAPEFRNRARQELQQR